MTDDGSTPPVNTRSAAAEIRRAHVGLATAAVICTAAFLFELGRARAGNTLSWVYVVEWPMILVFAVALWRRIVRQTQAETGERTPPTPPEEAPDPDLLAWQDYVRKVADADADGTTGSSSP